MFISNIHVYSCINPNLLHILNIKLLNLLLSFKSLKTYPLSYICSKTQDIQDKSHTLLNCC